MGPFYRKHAGLLLSPGGEHERIASVRVQWTPRLLLEGVIAGRLGRSLLALLLSLDGDTRLQMPWALSAVPPALARELMALDAFGPLGPFGRIGSRCEVD